MLKQFHQQRRYRILWRRRGRSVNDLLDIPNIGLEPEQIAVKRELDPL
jgi:hypothetical protein